ncbi:MAG: hypothetical protein P1V20_12495 [Verrucomicrobiales bacterium]|nr:hypothetical protein [Verrucomicrobiales bacterium]
MKTLLACRHALALEGFRGSDFERPLGARGVTDCINTGKLLHSRGTKPCSILTSSAFRARTTAHLIAGQLSFNESKIIEEESWYLAPADTWLRTIQKLPEDTETTLIFGHNPGMADFVHRIQRTPDYISFPPLSIAVIRFNLDHWGEADWGTGQLIEHLTPT